MNGTTARTLTEEERRAREAYILAEEFDVPDEPMRTHLVPLNIPIGAPYSGPALCGKIVNGTTFMPGTSKAPRCLACDQVAWERTR